MTFLTTLALCGWIWASAPQVVPPDFSGVWIAEPAAAPTAPAPPGTLARGDMGSGWGSPLTITQNARQLVVEQALFARGDMQPPLHFVYSLDGGETRNSVMIGHSAQVRVSRAAWTGQTLQITTSYPGVDPASGNAFITEVTHRLSLASPASLVIEVTRGAALGGHVTTTRTVYRKS
jgi:hypothetical protein